MRREQCEAAYVAWVRYLTDYVYSPYIKGEFTALTAGDKASSGTVRVIDPRGLGDRYDPLEGMQTQDELYSAAKRLMHAF